MTEAEQERAAVVAWLRDGGFAGHWRQARLATRLSAAWVAFKAPWAFAQASCKMAAERIERGDHLKDTTP